MIEVMNSTMSSSTSSSFSNAVNGVSVYIYSITLTVALITSAINMCVLSRRTLRKSACTHYFLASVLGTVIYMVMTPLNMILRMRYGIIFSSLPFGCKTTTFFTYASSLFTTLMLVCASIDRFFVSSSSARLRNLSKVYLAQRVIILVSILLFIYMSPSFIIYYWDYATKQCSVSSATLVSVYLSSRVVLYFIVSPLIMSIFSALTIYNVQSQVRRVAPARQRNARRRTEGQLARMLIIQVGVYIVFSFPAGVTYIIVTFVPTINTPFYAAIRNISIIWQEGVYCFSFFVYILSAKVYRGEMKKLFKWNEIRGRIMRDVVQGRTVGFQTNNIDDTRV